MSLGNNIHNAFAVVAQTYENVNKLMDYCRSAAGEKGEFVLATPRFLRYKSDANVSGWYISSFILLFQDVKDNSLENGWLDGPVYAFVINLFQPGVYDVPTVNIAKYEYADIQSWSAGCSPADHFGFYEPLYSGSLQFENKDAVYSAEVADTEGIGKRWWGLRRITGTDIPLTDITNENAYEKIFGGFRSLSVGMSQI